MSARDQARLNLATDIATWIDQKARELRAATGQKLEATDAASAIRTALMAGKEPWLEGRLDAAQQSQTPSGQQA